METEEPLDYRPVSFTTIVCKIYEKVTELTEYLQREGIMIQKIWIQNRKIMCHKLTMFLFKSDRYNARKRQMGGLHVFRFFKQAFDYIPHNRLQQKLEHKGGLKGTLKNWMENYLKGREIRTVVKDE